jgi:hypothetical protein
LLERNMSATPLCQYKGGTWSCIGSATRTNTKHVA